MTWLTRIGNAMRALRGYEGAGSGPRWPSGSIMAALPAAALAARPVLERKARWLVANTPIAESIANVWTTHVIADGPNARSAHPNRAMRRAADSAWTRFYRRADVEGGDLCSLLVRVVRGLVVDGESFVRLLTTARGELRLQLLPPSQIDSSVNVELPDGGTIISGIERGPHGEPRAYYVLPRSPDQLFSATGVAPVRVAASEICHVYEPRFAGQTRGVSWLHPVLNRILELDSTEDAGVKKAQVSALMCGFIRDLEGLGTKDDTASGELGMEPGTLRKLKPGTDITFTPVADMTGLNDFIKHIARSVCAGAHVPFELVAGDLTDVNFSSARIGLHNFQRRCTAIRASVLEARLLRPVWERMVAVEILSGRLNAPDFDRAAENYFAMTIMWPAWAQVNPKDDTEADVLAVNAGFRSRTEIIERLGRDAEDVNAEIASDTFRPRAPVTGANNVVAA